MLEIPNANRDLAVKIWRLAESFSGASDALTASVRAKTKAKKITLEELHVWVPMITLDSFAGELYFKTLHALEYGKKARGHKYKEELFEKLPLGTQTSIREMYKVRLKKQDISRMAIETRKLTPFDACLVHSSEVFERIRYIYEEPKVIFFYWPMLRLSIRDTIIGMCPDWSTPK